ncbi:hypothetical protein [Botrimarina mediterranea]|uniref:hypothetical protein n=1 Tax=Botrimarina mediterranea TaxID=2528022 RepID=UPI001188FA69|nr:hypothetical protein K2D_12910 [Planctomycetes bacterium K2D]
MTEAQAADLIAAVERIETLLEVLDYFVQVLAYATPAIPGLLLALLFVRALIAKKVIT